jgi:hypothetical protein
LGELWGAAVAMKLCYLFQYDRFMGMRDGIRELLDGDALSTWMLRMSQHFVTLCFSELGLVKAMLLLVGLLKTRF